MKRFQSKIRYISKETGLIGALFPPCLKENDSNIVNNSRDLQEIEKLKKPNKIKLNFSKIRHYTENTDGQNETRRKTSKSQDNRGRTVTLPRID